MYVKMSGVNEEQRDRVAAGVTVVVILVVPDELTVHSTTACIRRQVVLAKSPTSRRSAHDQVVAPPVVSFQ